MPLVSPHLQPSSKPSPAVSCSALAALWCTLWLLHLIGTECREKKFISDGKWLGGGDNLTLLQGVVSMEAAELGPRENSTFGQKEISGD